MDVVNKREDISVKGLRRRFKQSLTGDTTLSYIKNLFNRKYKIVDAVDDISFSIREGEFVGFVGENGAGKSTTIKTLTGILTPTSGEVKVCGIIPYKNRVANSKNIGVVFGQRTQLWWDLPLKESFELLKAIFRIDELTFRQRYDELVEIFNLATLLDRPVRSLSLGERMRADIAASLIHNPKVLFLDEPTIGLDLLAKEKVRFFLKKINEMRKTTILLTTHDMDDIEELCERVIILDEGKVVYDGSARKLKEEYISERMLDIEFSEKLDKIDFADLDLVSKDLSKVRLKVDLKKYNLPEIIGRFVNDYKVKDISVHTPKIAEVVKKIYEGTVFRQ